MHLTVNQAFARTSGVQVPPRAQIKFSFLIKLRILEIQKFKHEGAYE